MSTTSSKERLSLYRSLSQVNLAFHDIAAHFPPIISVHEASDLALYMDMNATRIAFDQERSVGTEQIMSSAPRPVERLYLHYKERLGYGEYQTDEKLNKIGGIVKDCRAAEVTFLPIGKRAVPDYPSEFDLIDLDHLLRSFSSLVEVHLYQISYIPRLPRLETLRILNDPPLFSWDTLPSLVPNLRRLDIIGPLDTRSLKLPSKLHTLVLDLHQREPGVYRWDLTQYRLGEALRTGLFSSSTARYKTIIIRSPPPLNWFEPTQMVGSHFGVRVVQEVSD